MNNLVVSKQRMSEILSSLMEEKIIAAPVSTGKVIDYLIVDDVSKILMGDEIPYKSPKEFFFPQCEKIITFKDDEAVAEKHDKELVVFGARPCDLEALKIITAIFLTGQFRDDFFKTRLDSSLIIGVACLEKKPGCFCEQRETNMYYSDACDLFIENSGENYKILFVSDKGREALTPFIPGLDGFENVPAPDFSPETTLTLEENELEMFDKIDWERLTETCQGCGMCTYICPTCHCFEFKDVDENGSVCRYRNWDSCMFPKFTLHASGHNPRDAVKDRYRQRVLHKYSYIKKNFGHVSCTGCGRCVRSCPAGVSIKTIVEEIMEELK